MPELPEVEVVRRGLDAHVVGRVLTSVELVGHRVARRHASGAADLAGRLTGRLVTATRRRGKYLWLDLAHVADGAVDAGSAQPAGRSDPLVRDVDPTARRDGRATPGVGRAGDVVPDEALVVHLGMSGQLLVATPGSSPARHQHATFSLTDPRTGATVRELRFVDQRTFGGLSLAPLVPDPADPSRVATVPEPVAHIAPDPFEDVFDRGRVVAAMKRRDSAVKRALLDQGLVSGIGNIYADEALWAAGVHGGRRCSALTRPTLARVLDEAQEVMSQALLAGGTSFDALYVDVDGASGYFSRELNVYGRSGQPCKRCGTPIVREKFTNRSSHFCPVCQRKR